MNDMFVIVRCVSAVITQSSERGASLIFFISSFVIASNYIQWRSFAYSMIASSILTQALL